ncbi:MAG TPA: hypothetical protein VGH86_04765 [Phenylobacterium sp.]|jgi:hypothetical protein
MTIPKGKAGKAKVHRSRPEPERVGPDRASRAAAPGAAPIAATGYPAGAGEDPSVSESVAHVVKVGYDVIAENIRQGREAAQRFRQGQYRVREVPGDLEVAAVRLLQLARELSTTTFDICERLLRDVGAKVPPEDRASGVPHFRAAKAAGGGPAKAAASPAPAEHPPMKVTVRFRGAARARAYNSGLARPKNPTAAADISAQPLARRTAGAKPITGVVFETDVSVEGIVAVVTVPDGQEPGVYSGLVHAKREDVPLGVLTIEIAK